MIGGGPGGFIGNVHRMAAALDGQIDLVCGAFSSDPQKSREAGALLYLSPDRSYGSYKEMIAAEQNRPGDKMDLVAIVTPNHLHFEPAMMALEAGFHVICDKPLTWSLEEASILSEKAKSSGVIFAVTYTYSAYPMIRQAKAMISNGMLGAIRRVVVEYPQGWLSKPLEAIDQKQASWRTDPSKSGLAGAMGDIGSHAFHLGEFVSGQKVIEIAADLHTHVQQRRLDDDGSVLLRFENGARGVMYASQISAGEENNLRLRVYGELGSVDWSQMEPNSLTVRWLDKPIEVYRTGGPGVEEISLQHSRVPAGHPEGYLEAFANIYRNVATVIQSKLSGKETENSVRDFPGIDDGVRGMQFIDAAVRSSGNNAAWVSLSPL